MKKGIGWNDRVLGATSSGGLVALIVLMVAQGLALSGLVPLETWGVTSVLYEVLYVIMLLCGVLSGVLFYLALRKGSCNQLVSRLFLLYVVLLHSYGVAVYLTVKLLLPVLATAS